MTTPPTLDNRPVAIFSDFDGTITQRDVIVMIMERFAPPVWREITDQILNQRTLSIREGVEQLFGLIPRRLRGEIEAFVAESVQLRPGFEAFLAACEARGIPFNVVSGGLDFFIRPVLAPFAGRIGIYCNVARFDQDTITVETPYRDDACPPCGQCGCCKLKVMAPYAGHYRIALGDSLTDLAMAREADWTFARSKLVHYCQEENIPFTPFETFTEIQTHIDRRFQDAAPR